MKKTRLTPLFFLMVFYVASVTAQELTVSSKIASSAADIEEYDDGTMNNSSTDLDLVNDNALGTGNQHVGLHFTGLSVPTGATITNAYIQFTTEEVATGTCNLTIKGEAADNPVIWTMTNGDVSGRTTTTASVNWIPSAWSVVPEKGTNQRTPDIKTIIQEIIDRSGYSSTDAINIIVMGTGRRTAESYDGAPSDAPELFITYTEAASGNWTLSGNDLNYTVGNVAIGTSTIPTGYKLAVDGKIISEGVKVQLQSQWPDYVFNNDYRLPMLQEIQDYIKEHGHLPNIPSAAAVKANGIELGEMNRLLLEKIEELTLYTIAQQKELQEKTAQLALLQKRLEKIEQLLKCKK